MFSKTHRFISFVPLSICGSRCFNAPDASWRDSSGTVGKMPCAERAVCRDKNRTLREPGVLLDLGRLFVRKRSFYDTHR